MKYKYWFRGKDRDYVFYADARVDAEEQFKDLFGVYPLPNQFLRRENS